MISILSILLLLGQVLAADYSTPTDGKFFYAKLNKGETNYYITVGVGEPAKQLNLLFNSEELTLALFTTICKDTDQPHKCNVPTPYDPENDSKISARTTLTNEQAYLFNKGAIQNNYLGGWDYQTLFNFTLKSYLREFSYSGFFFSIEGLTQTYETRQVDGFVGFGPYTSIGTTGNDRIEKE